MKKLIFLITLLLAVVIISSYNKPDALQTKSYRKTLEARKMTTDKPDILLLLTNDKSRKGLSPYLWWSYNHSNLREAGC